MLTALIFLVIISLLAISAVKFSSAGMRSATNEELRISSFIDAQSVIEGTVALPGNTPVTTDTNIVLCTPTAPAGDPPCTSPTITFPDGMFADEVAAGTIQARVQRTNPQQALPPRGLGTSMVGFYAAAFIVQGTHDETATGYGRTQINEGLLLILPNN